MRKGLIWKTAAAAATALLLVCAPMALQTEKASADTLSEFPCTYSAAPVDKEYMCYGSKEVKSYTAEEAAAAGIPAGYEDGVFEIVSLNGGANCGALLDFSAGQFSQNLVEGLTFRIYIGQHASNTGSRPEMRIAKPFDVNNSWVWQPGVRTPDGEWTEITVPSTQANFPSLFKDGYLDKFELSVRANAAVPVYVDSITVNLKANDGVAPVITYNGEDTVYTNENSTLAINASAYDAQEQRAIEVEQVWEGESPVLESGKLKQGTYVLILRATDTYGNVAEKKITVIVEEADTENPVIHLNVSEVSATVGTIPVLNATATDDSGRAEISYAWSAGALDELGKLTKGTHTWTVTAKDPSGNTATKTVTFIVTDEEDLGDNVIDEENISNKYTVTFDGENAQSYSYGWKIEKPEDPVRADEEGVTFTFIGWYNGETAWDFSKDVVTGDLQLVSKWTETKAKYSVTFDGKNAAEYEYGDKLVKPTDPTKKSSPQYYYEFDGWYNGDVKWDFNTDTVSGDLALVSKFIERQQEYTVTFDGENGVKYHYGDLIEKPADPTKDGFEFLYWCKGTLEWNFEKYTVTGDMDLTAKWKKTDGAQADSSTDESADATDTDTNTDGGDEGCGSAIGVSAVGLTLLGAAVLFVKKRED